MDSRAFGMLVMACLTSVIAVGPSSAVAQTYSLVDLGALGGLDSTGYAINSVGEVAGDSTTAGGVHAFKYTNGKMLDLGVLPGYSNSFGRGINDSGQVTGFSGPDVGDGHAFWYSNGTMTDIGTLGGANSFAYGINASGQITGASDTSGSRVLHAFVYSNGVMTDLNAAIGSTSSKGNAINDSGNITGQLTTVSNGSGFLAFLYANGAVTTASTLGGSNSYGNAINSVGVVAGYGLTPTAAHAFTFSNGVTTDLGTLPGATLSDAYGINTKGQVVGNSDGNGFIFSNGVMTDLNALINAADPLRNSVRITAATAINDNGWILASGETSSYPVYPHAFLLQPTWLTVAPTTLSFGNQKIGSASSTQPVVITNTGSTSLGVSVAISSNFVQTNNCGVALAAGAMCTVQVGFAPSAPDTLIGSLTVTPAGTASLVTGLAGVGQASLSMSTSASSVTAGVAVTLTWTASPSAVCTASGGSTADGWIGALSANGSMAVTETAAGTYTYSLMCVAGSQSLQAQEVVQVTVPTVSISATPTNLAEGQSTTLTWMSANASSCSASGNGTDGWSGAKATSGTVSVTESANGLITYKITCTSGPQSVSASTQVFFSPRASGGGGGSLDLLSVLFLSGIAVWRRFRQYDLRTMLQGC